MAFAFRTVRAKLLTLVALPVVLLGVALPLLSSVMRQELIDEADNRLDGADRSFQTELDDDLADLTLAVRVLARDPETARALSREDGAGSLDLARVFAGVYPNVDIVFAAATGRVIADVGPTAVPPTLAQIPELAHPPAEGEAHAIAAHGCAAPQAHAAPARVIARAVGAAGWVVACEPLDRAYVENAAAKLGLEIALLDGDDGRALSAATPRFPMPALARAGARPTLFESGGRTYVAVRTLPRLIERSHGGRLAVVTTIDVTDLRAIVRRHLFVTLALLLLVAALSVAIGARLAGVMSRALRQIIDAFRRLEKQEYVRVSPLRSRDELETLATGFNRMVEGLIERDKLRSTFGKYMTESVLEHLLSGKVQLGGETLCVTILFSDIRSFTTISETMDAHALVSLLNEYFTEMVGIVMRHNGVVDKYIGDAIMAVFGAPVPRADDAENAVLAAVEMRKALAGLNTRLAARGVPALRTGIGVHTGEVVAGNIGSEQRMEYTVIGDPVNLASRLESSTKDLGVNILISSDTYERVKHVVDARPVRQITVKGRVQSVTTYEVVGRRGEPPLPRDE